MKKKIAVSIVIIALVTCVMLTLTSCGLFKKGGTVETPIIKAINLIKPVRDYEKSNEYQYNVVEKNNETMAVVAEDKFYVSLEYENKGGYAISYVTINNDKYMPSQFESTSTKQNTIIELSTQKSDVGSELTYTVKNVFFNTGSETKRMKVGEDTNTTFHVVVSPSYQITLDYQNADKRTITTRPVNTVASPQTVAFGASLSTIGLADAKYDEPTGRPTKDGGWVFEGWFTEPNGKGIQVFATDKYYFWSNITLYAHFSRLFEFKTVDLDEPLVHNYSGYVVENGETVLKQGSVTFTSGAIITKKLVAMYPEVDVCETIVDEKITVDEATGKEIVTTIEYPVVEVGASAFEDDNGMTTLTVGKYVETINYRAFRNCNKLERVTFASDSRLKYIGDYAFNQTVSMGVGSASFTLPATVEYLGNFAFWDSGWRNTMNSGTNESILHIKPTYKFIGVMCFKGTGFKEVVFDAGCKFDSQIDIAEGQDIVSVSGWKDIRSDLNRIGCEIFANCAQLDTLTFDCDTGESNALNIIPDKAFDAGNYYSAVCLQNLKLNEGLEFIGREAFNYQQKITELEIPATVKEIGRAAFYNCDSVLQLTFATGSRLETLHANCFGNMTKIDRVEIISDVFRQFGNGPFRGCSRLKSIEFPNIFDKSNLPRGFSRDGEYGDEVISATHKYADLMYGTFQNVEGEGDSGTYSIPTRVFCNGTVTEAFKQILKEGKATYVFDSETGEVQRTLAGPSQFENVVFVHSLENIMRDFEYADGRFTDIAFQELYDANSGRVIGLSIIYWSDRSTDIVLPTSAAGLAIGNNPVIELGMYALPTSVVRLTIPSNIVRIEHDALRDCTQLEDVVFEDVNTLEYVGDNAFLATAITKFEGGTSLKVIGYNAFRGCKSLRWVDLHTSPITNAYQGKRENIRQYKYEYEKTDKNGDKTQDYRDTLYDGAFELCQNLSWIYLPTTLVQVSNNLFGGCSRLTTVIMPSKGVSKANVATDKGTFYANATPAAVFQSDAAAIMQVYVPASEIVTHETIYPAPVGRTRYYDIETYGVPEHP